jgi:hypothetical protein
MIYTNKYWQFLYRTASAFLYCLFHVILIYCWYSIHQRQAHRFLFLSVRIPSTCIFYPILDFFVLGYFSWVSFLSNLAYMIVMHHHFCVVFEAIPRHFRDHLQTMSYASRSHRGRFRRVTVGWLCYFMPSKVSIIVQRYCHLFAIFVAFFHIRLIIQCLLVFVHECIFFTYICLLVSFYYYFALE